MPDITPHVCCHTYCSNMAKSGMNSKTLQYLMGHADIGTTLNVYTHVNFEDAKAQIEMMNIVKKLRCKRKTFTPFAGVNMPKYAYIMLAY